MSVEKGIEVKVGGIFGRVFMTVCKEETLAFVHDDGIVCHDGEVEQHLVDLAITIATNCYDAIGMLIEFISNGLWVVTFGKTVSRTKVEQVTEEHEHIALFAVEIVEHAVKRNF